MSGCECGRDPVFGEHAPGDHAYGEDGRLGVFSEAQLVFGTVKKNAAQGKSQRFVGFGKGRGGDGESFGERTAHADGLRTLAGKEECDLFCSHTGRNSTGLAGNRAESET
jgi:hypothetical protein